MLGCDRAKLTLFAHRVGTAELVVRGPAGDERRLPIEVAERDSAYVTTPLFCFFGGCGDGPQLPIDEVALSVGVGWGRELAVRDATLIPSLKADEFSRTEPDCHEGPVPVFEGVAIGETTVRVRTTTGVDLTIPIRVGTSPTTATDQAPPVED